jgi:hypothetical protein
MSSFTLVDATVIVNGVNLSDHVTSVTVHDDRPQVDNSAMGGTALSFTKGLGTASIEVNFFQDFTGGKVHATLSPLIPSVTPIAVEVRATSAARSATNPAALLASALLFSYSMLDGALGAMSNTKAIFTNASPTGGMTYPTS